MVVDEQLRQELLSKRVVADAMHPGVITCAPDAVLAQVAHMMDWYRIHAVVVDGAGPDPAEGVWGIVSDLDLLAALAEGDVGGRTAGGAARTPLVVVRVDESLHRAAERMAAKGVTHAVVVADGSERPIGVLSSLDLVRELARVGWAER